MPNQQAIEAEILTQATLDWLTDTQAAALAALHSLVRYPNIVNLWGPTGTGKTFLCRVWAKAESVGVTYRANLDVLQDNQQHQREQLVLLDNLSAGDRPLRDAIAWLQLRGVVRAVLITQHPNELRLPMVALSLPTQEDMDIVYRNLSELDRHPVSPVRPPANLWDVLKSVLP